MPTYEYLCKKCGYTFEKFQSIKAVPLQNCPKCNGEVCRLISKNASFILKGSGYYSTDNRKSHLPKQKISGTDKPVKGKPEKATLSENKKETSKAKKEATNS